MEYGLFNWDAATPAVRKNVIYYKRCKTNITNGAKLTGDEMKANGPRIERETIIRWDEVNAMAEVWTASQPVYRKLVKLGYEPKEDGERSATFEVPKRRVAIRGARVLSEKQRQVLQSHRFLAVRRQSSRKVGT
jgi:hypothetical protein